MRQPTYLHSFHILYWIFCIEYILRTRYIVSLRDWFSFGIRHSALGIVLLFAGCSKYEPLVWHDEAGYRWADITAYPAGDAGFEQLEVAETGISFINTLSEEAFLQNRHYVNGSGVALGDVDGDGLTDIYIARLEGPNALFRNRGGWRFEEIGESAGVTAPDRFSTGAVFADVDGDADLDLLLTSMGAGNALFVNDGSGRFSERSIGVDGVAGEYGSTTLALADVDDDADLDLYIGNYKKRSIKDIVPPPVRAFEATVTAEQGEYQIQPDFEKHYRLTIEGNRLVRYEYAEPDLFYLNDGEGGFLRKPFTDGLFLDPAGRALTQPLDEWALVARFQDVNGDGAPDLYLCNDFESPDRFWINRGDGTFQEAPAMALRKTSGSSMSVAFSDIDRDADVDFFVADMLYPDYSARQVQVGMQAPTPEAIGEIENRPQHMQNMLMLNRGDGTFADIARLSGVEASGWTWSSTFLDVDLDGFEDLLLTTGHHYNAMDADVQMQVQRVPVSRAWREMLLMFPPLKQPNVAFRNVDGLTFHPVDEGWGFGFESDVSHGMAFGDLDNDGDLDIVVNRLNELAGVYRNTGAAPRIAVRLRGLKPNTQGIGAKIRLLGGPVPVQEKEVISGGEYLSGSDPVYSFAAGDAQEGLAIEVAWRSGRVSRIDGVRANRVYEVFEGGSGDE